MNLSSIKTALGIAALSDIVEEERDEIERLEYEKRCLEDEIQKMTPPTKEGHWTKDDQENFELNWHSNGTFDLDGKKVTKQEENSDFSNFIW